MGAPTQELTVTADDFQQITRAEAARFTPLNIELAVMRRERIAEAVERIMKVDQDYGIIPGTQRPTLLQPGADKLNSLFGLIARHTVTDKIEDWTGENHGGEPLFSYTVTCQLYRNDFLMGEGSGECNSWESKYRYRKAERVCPECGAAAIIKSRFGAGGWYCFPKKGGCDSKFQTGDKRIEEQVLGRVANPDIFDQKNTILKMAMKRAKIAATLNATSAHEFFTQDVEDMPQFAGDQEGSGQQQPQGKPQTTGNTPRAPQKPPEPQQQREESPEAKERARVLASMTDAKSIGAAITGISAQFLQYRDQSTLDQILSEHQMLPGQARTIKKAKECWIVLQLEIQKAMKADSADEPPLDLPNVNEG